MKHVLKIIVSLSLFSMAFTQEDTTTVDNEELRANTLSFSAFWGAFGLIHANYGKVMDNGKKEYQLLLGTFGYEDDYSDAEADGDFIDGTLYGAKGASGIRLAYKQYRKEGAKGLFYQAHVRLLSYTWGYKLDGADWKDVNTFVFQPSVVIGYKYHPPVLKKRLFVEAYVGGGYSYDNPEDNGVKLMWLEDEDDTGSAYEAGSNEFAPDLNVYIGYTF